MVVCLGVSAQEPRTMPLRTGDVIDALEFMAPLRFAAAGDPVGLMVGSRNWPADRVLLTIDLTAGVLDEAVEKKVGFVIAYHPLIYRPLSRLTEEHPRQALVLRAIRERIAVYSPHTALDAAPGGINDWIAEGLGAGDVRALDSHAHQPETEQVKVVTFCPLEAVERIRNGLSSIGAGRIGDYHLCSFEMKGTGTFFGGDGTTPTVGRNNTLERIDEVRLEMVCPKAALALAVTVLKQFHPYEEPPIELYELLARPLRDTGQGRRLVLDQPTSVKTLAARLKEQLGVKRAWVAAAPDGAKRIETIGICAGSGAGLLDSAIAQGCELFVTGEMKHHEILSAMERGCAILLAGHTNTERGYLKVLRDRLSKMIDDLTISVSREDRSPLVEI